MIIVIQCAARKQSDAGYITTANGKRILFVADPESAPTNKDYYYARPDDLSDREITWREVLLKYNKNPEDNPLDLCPAYQLYYDSTYERLVRKFGLDRVFILSAGWGLIAANFLTPNYDITFSQKAESYKCRKKKDVYNDICMLPDKADEPLVFLGGKDYIPLFCLLTKSFENRKTVFYYFKHPHSEHPPEAPGCTLERFEGTRRTNWHYDCAKAILDGKIGSLQN